MHRIKHTYIYIYVQYIIYIYTYIYIYISVVAFWFSLSAGQFPWFSGSVSAARSATWDLTSPGMRRSRSCRKVAERSHSYRLAKRYEERQPMAIFYMYKCHLWWWMMHLAVSIDPSINGWFTSGWWWLEHDFYFPFSWEFHDPNWRTHIFQKGWNHQPVHV